MNSKFKKKGDIVPSSVIEKRAKRALCCQEFMKCLENCIETSQRRLVDDCFTSAKRQKRNSYKMKSKNKIRTKKQNNFNFNDENHNCSICLEQAIDRDVNNSIISNRNFCYLNRKHYFYLDDSYFQKEFNLIQNKYDNTSNSTNRKIKNNIKITFALIFGDNSNFDVHTNEAGINSCSVNDSYYESLNVIVTSL